MTVFTELAPRLVEVVQTLGDEAFEQLVALVRAVAAQDGRLRRSA